jgi:pimeloyl-ACP methyl ester carboxylesterase
MARVVLVHGAWHGAWCWDGVVAELDEMGVECDAVELPLTGFGDDVAVARAAIAAAGPGTVVVGHSYGGAVITQAASGLENVERLVYLAAFMTDVDEEQTSFLEGSPLLASLEMVPGGIAVDPARVHELFFGDSEDSVVAEIIPRLRPMGTDADPGPTDEPAWKRRSSTYVVCTADAALPPSSQRTMASRANDVVEWPTDHSPFLTRPRDLAELIASYL